MAASPEPTTIVPLHPATAVAEAAEQALAAVHRHLARCKLAASTVKAYRRQTSAYVTWLASHAAAHPDAFADTVGRLDAGDIVITARTGAVRLHGKGDEIRTVPPPAPRRR